MTCKRCPHLVRHGVLAADKKNIEFENRCGLKMRAEKQVDCKHFPFPKVFDYQLCDIYLDTFKSGGQRNDVVPTRDFQYSEALACGSITDMELL